MRAKVMPSHPITIGLAGHAVSTCHWLGYYHATLVWVLSLKG